MGKKKELQEKIDIALRTLKRNETGSRRDDKEAIEHAIFILEGKV